MNTAFNCQCCGHCCEGRGGIVVSPADLVRLCTHLAVPPEQFEASWGERHGEKLHIKTNDSNVCIFFEQGIGCAVHEAKPSICQAWPYFRGNLVDAESFALAKEFCPGIPAKQSFQSFVAEGLAYITTNKLAATSDKQEARALCIADLLP